MTAPSHQDVGERRAEAQVGRPLSAVYVAVAVFYVASALMNGRFLHEDASKREFGRARDFWVAVTRPLSEFSTRLHLDAIRGGAEQLRKE